MPEVNCHVPIRLRLRGLPDAARLEALGAAVTRAVTARLRYAAQTLAGQSGESAAFRAHPPTFNFRGEAADEASRVRVELCVRNAVARALSGAPAPAPRVVRAGAQLNVAPGRERSMWELLREELRLSRNDPRYRDAETEDLARRRGAAVDALLALLERPEARAMLREALDAAEPFSPVRLQILDALLNTRGGGEAARDLILYGSGHGGERMAEEDFARWLGRGDGAEAVGYLERKLRGEDAELQRKAAHVVVELLKLENSEQAKHLRPNLKRLRRMASENGLLERGALGLESLRQLADSQLAVLLDLIPPIRLELRYSEIGDPHAEADDAALRDLASRLAAVREDLPRLDLPSLKQTDEILSQMIQAAVRMTRQVRDLQAGVRTMQQVLDTPSTEADEIKALIQIRHEYVSALAGALDDEDFAGTVAKVDLRFSNYDRVVAGIKWGRLRGVFRESQAALANILGINFGTTNLPDTDYEKLVADVAQTEDVVRRKFNLPPDPGGARAPFLAEATEIEPLVIIFSLRVAMLGQYAAALYMLVGLQGQEVGSEEFRREQARTLTGILARLKDYYRGDDFEGYAKAFEELKGKIEQAQQDLGDRVRRDVAVQLAITAASALLAAFGGYLLTAGALARVATLGRIIMTLRAAGMLGALTLAVETGVFTAASLAGERLVFGRKYTLGQAAESFVTNLAFGGVFKLVGKVTEPLARSGGALRRLVVPQLVGVTGFTALPALTTALETGRWPEDMKEFLLHGLANYLVISGVNAAVKGATRSRIDARARAQVQAADAELARLFERYQRAIKTRTLTEQEFESIRRGRLALNERMRALVEVLRVGGYLAGENAEGVEELLKADAAFVAGVQFNASPLAVAGAPRTVRALPAPQEVEGLTPVGDGTIYRYEPGAPPAGLSIMISLYEQAGHMIQRYAGGTVRVTNPADGKTFIVEPGPRVRPLLPLPERGTPLMLESGVTRTLSREQLLAAEKELRVVKPGAVKLMLSEFPEEVAVAALNLLYANRGKFAGRWGIASLRGLAAMMDKSSGIPHAEVERLFNSGLTSAQLGELFEKFGEVSEMPGAHMLVGRMFTPEESLQMVRTYRQLMAGNFKLPSKMSREAMLGLKRWASDTSKPLEERFRETDVDGRLVLLEVAGGKAVAVGARLELVLQEQFREIRPGIDLHKGSADDAVRAVEEAARAKGGRFSEPAVRERFRQMIEGYRRLVAKMRAGENVERNVVGAREEIETVVVGLESGGEVFALGSTSQETSVYIDPGHYPLPNGGRVLNARQDVTTQLDLGVTSGGGKIDVLEATTAEFGLPESLQSLDPLGGVANKDIDFRALDENDPVQRKWKQVLKLRALVLFSADLARAMGQTDVEAADVTIRASRISARAKRALNALGLKYVETNPR